MMTDIQFEKYIEFKKKQKMVIFLKDMIANVRDQLSVTELKQLNALISKLQRESIKTKLGIGK